MHPERRSNMLLDPETEPAPRKAARGVEPLRRKRVKPEPIVVSARGRRILNVLLGFATVVMMVDALVGEKGLMARMRAREEFQKQVGLVHAVKAKNAQLRETAARLRDDPSAAEAIARQELGLIREGEVLFLVRDAKPARDSKSGPAPSPAAAAVTFGVK